MEGLDIKKEAQWKSFDETKKGEGNEGGWIRPETLQGLDGKHDEIGITETYCQYTHKKRCKKCSSSTIKADLELKSDEKIKRENRVNSKGLTQSQKRAMVDTTIKYCAPL